MNDYKDTKRKVQLLDIENSKIKFDQWNAAHTAAMLALHGKKKYLKYCIRGNVVNTIKVGLEKYMDHLIQIQQGVIHPDSPFEVSHEFFAKCVSANPRTLNDHIIRLEETAALTRVKGYCRFGKGEGRWTAEPLRMPHYELNAAFLVYWESNIQTELPLQPSHDESTGYPLKSQFLPQTISSSLTQINEISGTHKGVDKSTNHLERVPAERLHEHAEQDNAEKQKNVQSGAERMAERMGMPRIEPKQECQGGTKPSSGVAPAGPKTELGKAKQLVTELKGKNEHNYCDTEAYKLLLFMLRLLYNGRNLSILHFIQCKEYIYEFLRQYVELNTRAGGKDFKTLMDEASNCFRIRIMLRQENKLRNPQYWIPDPVYYLTRSDGFASSKKAYEMYIHNAKLNRKIHKKRKTNLQVFTEQVKLFETNPVEWQYKQCLKTLEATSELYKSEFVRFTNLNQTLNSNI